MRRGRFVPSLADMITLSKYSGLESRMTELEEVA